MCKDCIFNSSQDIAIQFKKVRSAELTSENSGRLKCIQTDSKNFDKIAEKTWQLKSFKLQ